MTPIAISTLGRMVVTQQKAAFDPLQTFPNFGKLSVC